MPADAEQQGVPNSTGKTAMGYFFLVVIGALLAGFIGGGFGALIATISPQFVKNLFSLKPEDGSVFRYASSVGMISGLFIGVAVACFACLLSAIVKIVRLRIEHRKTGNP